MLTRPLLIDDRPALEALLMCEPSRNVFHLSGLVENGLPAHPNDRAGSWAVGAFDKGDLVGAVVAVRGTGGTYCPSGDQLTLRSLAGVVYEKAVGGPLGLLSGHASQLDPLLPLIAQAGLGRPDRCYFRTLTPATFSPPLMVAIGGSSLPILASDADMERLIDFYQIGFYSLAHLPSREAWRDRLTEQLAFRTMYFIEDERGLIVSAAQSSAEGGGAAMIGGVATRREYVSRGLSTLCVAALCERLFSTGTRTISLFYLKENLAAGRVYEKLGFRDDGEWLLVPLGMGGFFRG